MASAGGKKNSICRYFAQNGECFYGNECQFIHSRGQATMMTSLGANNLHQQQQQHNQQQNHQQNHQNHHQQQNQLQNQQQQQPQQPQNLHQHHQHQMQHQQHHDVTGVNTLAAMVSTTKIGQGLSSTGTNGMPFVTVAPVPANQATSDQLHHVGGVDQLLISGSKLTNYTGQPNTSAYPTSAGAAAAATTNTTYTGSSIMGEESNELKEEILQRQNVTSTANNTNLMPTESQLLESLPERVLDYTDLYPLQSGHNSILSNTFGFVQTVYRATNIETNQYVCMRRVHSYQANAANSKSLLNTIDAWKKIQCANIVRLFQVFTTRAFGDNSLVFVYPYFPQATTLMQQYFVNSSSTSGPVGINGFTANRPYSQQQAILKNKLLPENLLWHYIIQISSALRLIHSHGLAYRIFDPTKVLLTSSVPNCPPSQLQPSQYPRIRLNACGLFDIVTHDLTIQNQMSNAKGFYQQLQQDDLAAFGRLCLALATSSVSAASKEYWQQSLELVSRTYSNDLRALIVTLLSIKQQNRTINDVMPMIGARFYVQLNLAYDKIDNIQMDLDREVLNGRLIRVLVKLGMINERPELRMDLNWSETGDRYMLKLFRDYLFHQLNEDGSAWLDMGHVVSTLMKFDSGSPEKICLISRDEQHVLVVSFAELKKCFENAFSDLQC